MQNKAAVHTAHHSKAWFREIKMAKISLLALSSIIKSIENIIVVLDRQVYGKERRLSYEVEIILVVLKKWGNFCTDILISSR